MKHTFVLLSSISAAASSACVVGTYQCTADETGVQVCDLNGGWTLATGCPPSTHCITINSIPYCVVPDLCSPNTLRCSPDLSGIQVCDAQGHWTRSQTCLSTQRCAGGASPFCMDLCAPGTRQCSMNGQGWNLCNSTGYWIPEHVCQPNQECIGGSSPMCQDLPPPECEQGTTRCGSYDNASYVYGCNTHNHLVPLTRCPAGWMCADEVPGFIPARCQPPLVPDACQPSYQVGNAQFLVLANSMTELRFDIDNGITPKKNCDQTTDSDVVKTNTTLSCSNGAEYRLTYISVGSVGRIKVDILDSFSCGGQLWGLLSRDVEVVWQCAGLPYPFAGASCGFNGTVGVGYDDMAPLDDDDCLPVADGPLVSKLCPLTWS
ncbi:hypothetical protein QBC47DRAFT_375650 [Echria macrotheca]|uniref:Uncharacterized protein n=1 Tax=Echria macrotheca TaxID=438768 RepID=A0AAJ0BI66_9PEZI|nr:hypothetical protein QBC47DRAFT_375650 [Echria macrotheca]